LSVIVLVGSGIGASVVHLPTFASLWETSYGKTILVKIALLLTALGLAAVNLARTVPRLKATRNRPDIGPGAALLLRRLVGAQTLLVTGAVAAAATLSSLPPPSQALAKAGNAAARVGPGPVTSVVSRNGYRLEFHVDPNRAAVPNTFALRISRDGKPVRN